MSEKMPQQIPGPHERSEPESARKYGDVVLLKEGGKYLIDDGGEKRLEVTAEQVQEAEHNMAKDLMRLANLNHALRRVGLESLEGLPTFRVPSHLPDYEYVSGAGAPCCNPDDPKVISAMRSQYPEMGSTFILRGCAGERMDTVVNGDKSEWIGISGNPHKENTYLY